MKPSDDTLGAAKAEIKAQIARLQHALQTLNATGSRLSPAGREAIAAAARRRWDAYRRSKGAA